jgi:hypothetical protein
LYNSVWYNGSPLRCKPRSPSFSITCILTSFQRQGGFQCTRYLGTSNRSRPIKPSPLSTRRFLASQSIKDPGTPKHPSSEASSPSPESESESKSPTSSGTLKPSPTASTPSDWEDNPNYSISQFSELPHSNFGVNQHIVINDEFKEALRQILWQFRAPIRYAFAYGSGVFPQSKPVRDCPESLGALKFGHKICLGSLSYLGSILAFTFYHQLLEHSVYIVPYRLVQFKSCTLR